MLFQKDPDIIEQEFFLCIFKPQGQHCIKYLICFNLYVFSDKIKKITKANYNYNIQYFRCDMICDIYLCNVVKSIKTTLNRNFSYALCCLQSLGWATCISFYLWNVPKSIRAKLNKIFFCALFSGASRTTLNRLFTWSYLPVAVQCCSRSIKKTLDRSFSVQCWLKSLGETLLKVFTSQGKPSLRLYIS